MSYDKNDFDIHLCNTRETGRGELMRLASFNESTRFAWLTSYFEKTRYFFFLLNSKQKKLFPQQYLYGISKR